MKSLKESIKMINNRLLIFLSIAFCILGLVITSCSWNYEQESQNRLVVHQDKLKAILSDTLSSAESGLRFAQQFEHAFSQKKTINDFVFEAEYQPHLIIALKNKSGLDTTNKSIKCMVQDYSNLHYVTFSIENKKFKSELLRYELSSAQEYSDRITYYSFNSQKESYIIENDNDTLRGAFVHFERTFDVSPKLNITFVFERKSHLPIQKLNFVFDDIVFNNGKIEFEFDYKTISTLNAEGLNKLLL
jgi:hypothetical protein